MAMSNLYNRYKSVERKNSQKNPEYMLITHCHVAAVKIWLILIYNKAAMDNFLVTAAILNGERSCRTQF
jgi:hypothetical protein